MPDRFLVGLGLVLLVAGATRLVGLTSAPAGLLDAEAAHGLLAREAVGGGLAVAREAGERSPLLAGLIALVGQVRGFDVATPRIGAALAGIGTVVLTALWLRRALGAAWGLAGGLIVAGGFWPLLFGRLALSPAAGALALAALLWLLQEAIARPRPGAFVWYALAGVAAGVGFAADPPLRVIPLLLLLALGAAAWESRRPGNSLAHPDGIAVTLGVAILTAMPFVLAQRDDPARLVPWTPTPGLPGDAQTTPSAVLLGYVASAARIVWPGSSDPALNLPGDALLGPLLVPWALLGLVVVVRHLRTPFGALGAAWGLLLLLAAASSDPGHPGRLLAALPLLVALPVLGMRAAAGWARHERLRPVLAALAIASLLGSAVWSGWRYAVDWAPADATARAFTPGVTQSVLALADAPLGVPIVYSVHGHQPLLRYLAPDAPRIDVDGRHLFSLPARDARLVIPRETPVDPALLAIFDGIPPLEMARDANGEELYRIYQIDARVRGRLPFGVPTTPFDGGIVFEGYRISPDTDGRLAIVLAWRTAGIAAPERLVVRLHAPNDPVAPAAVATIPIPPAAAAQPGTILTLASLAPPATGEPVHFDVALLDADGRPIAAPGIDPDGYLLIDRFRFEP